MSNSLVTPADLTAFPGAPFTDDVVDAAVAELRRQADWHIAPERMETLTVDGSDSCLLTLPTLWLTSVTAVRDITDAAHPVALSNWRAARAGMLRRAGGWPQGFLSVEADVTHGYAETPADLLPVIASMCVLARTESDAGQESLGSWSVTVREALPKAQAETLAGYSVPRFK